MHVGGLNETLLSMGQRCNNKKPVVNPKPKLMELSVLKFSLYLSIIIGVSS